MFTVFYRLSFTFKSLSDTKFTSFKGQKGDIMNKELLIIFNIGAHNNQAVAVIARLGGVYCEGKLLDISKEHTKAKASSVIGDEERNIFQTVRHEFNHCRGRRKISFQTN